MSGPFLISGMSDTGLVRSNNQDCIHVDTERGLFVLADGVGGGPSGQLASQTVVDSVCRSLHEELDNPWYRFWGRGDVDRLAVMERAVQRAHDDVVNKVAEQAELKGMASTLLIGVLGVGRCLCVSVGDSRLYHLSTKGMRQVSRDQTLAEQLCEQGFLTSDDERYQRYSHVLIHAIGGEKPPEVQKHRVEMQVEDRVLACSDGLSGMLNDGQIASVADSGQTLHEQAEGLVEAANQAGGRDNVSVIVAQAGMRGILPLCG